MAMSPDYRSLELDAAAATAVARGSTVSGELLKIGIPFGAVLVAGWMIYSSVGRAPTNMTTPDKEDFKTVQFPAPSLEEPRPSMDQGTIVIPPAPLAPPDPVLPPPPVAPPMALPAPPPPEPQSVIPPPNDDEARRLAELERQRQEEERQRWERFRAPQVITDHTDQNDQSADPDGANRSGGGQDDDPNRRFLASVSNAGVEVAKATQNHRIDALVAQGTMIRGVLETALQSDLPGMVRAVTAENIWSFDGRRVLIPAGSRLVGEYKSGLSQGQTRVFIVWTRLLRSDGVSVQIVSNGADDLGRAGNAGFVDNHYLERFGTAAVLSLVGGISQYLSSGSPAIPARVSTRSNRFCLPLSRPANAFRASCPRRPRAAASSQSANRSSKRCGSAITENSGRSRRPRLRRRVPSPMSTGSFANISMPAGSKTSSGSRS